MSSYFQNEFTTTSPPVKVIFKVGASKNSGEEISALGCSRALVLSTEFQRDIAQQLIANLGAKAVGLFADAQMHTPIDVTQKALEYAKKVEADCIIAIGGGSTTGLSKAIAYRTDLPQIIIPTTYAGSEATSILGQTENGIKTTVTANSIQPEVIIYDAELVRSLPVDMTITSALNAMAHAAEALYAKNRNPIATMQATEGLRAFANSLALVRDNPDNLEARGETLFGAWLCGSVLGQVGMALHHKLCHTLGGSFDLPHAQTHAILLPHTIAYNARAVSDLLTPVSEIFGADNAGTAIYQFAQSLDAPSALRELGLKKADLDQAVTIATKNPYWNPQPIEKAALRSLLQAAWEGSAPIL